MVELYPKVNGEQIWRGNYRKAAAWLWYHPFIGNYYIGFGNYFVKTFPSLCLTLWFADKVGLMAYHNHDFMTIRGSPSYEDNDE